MAMRKIIVSIFLTSMMFTSLFSQEKATPKKFLGEIQAGAILVHNNMMSGILPEASASFGVNFNSRFSAGLGVSTVSFVTATPYIFGKVNFVKNEQKKIIPFLSVNAGYWINFESVNSEHNGISIQPKLGLSFYGKQRKSSFIVYLGGSYYYDKFLPSVGIGLGF